jgi:hypothetical protein
MMGILFKSRNRLDGSGSWFRSGSRSWSRS